MALAKPRKLTKLSGKIQEIDYVEGRDDLTSLSLDELAFQFESIEQQSQLLQGRILLEARSRLNSDIEFGEWVSKYTGTLCSTTRQQRTRLMNLARYFGNKDTKGISLTACYEISAPTNTDVADKVYEYALNRNLSVVDIKAKIKEEKKLLPILERNHEEEHNHEVLTETNQDTIKKEELMPREDVSEFVKLILSDVQSLPQNEAVRVLKLCLKELNRHPVENSVVDV